MEDEIRIIEKKMIPGSWLSYMYLHGFNFCGGKGHPRSSTISSGFCYQQLVIVNIINRQLKIKENKHS